MDDISKTIQELLRARKTVPLDLQLIGDLEQNLTNLTNGCWEYRLGGVTSWSQSGPDYSRITREVAQHTE